MNERRMNITIADAVADIDAIFAVRIVVLNGRISGDGDTYCYVTSFGDGLTVLADRTRKGNDTIKVVKDKRGDE